MRTPAQTAARMRLRNSTPVLTDHSVVRSGERAIALADIQQVVKCFTGLEASAYKANAYKMTSHSVPGLVVVVSTDKLALTGETVVLTTYWK